MGKSKKKRERNKEKLVNSEEKDREGKKDKKRMMKNVI